MIVGAGSAASLLIKELEFGPGSSRIVCIIDDGLAETGQVYTWVSNSRRTNWRYTAYGRQV